MFRLFTLSVLLCALALPIKGFCDGNDPWENLKFIPVQQVEIEKTPSINLDARFRDEPRAFVYIPISRISGGIHFSGRGSYGTEGVLSTRGEHDFHIILNRFGILDTFTFEHGTRKIFEPSHPLISRTVRFELNKSSRVVFLDKIETGLGRSCALVVMDLNYLGVFDTPKFVTLLVSETGRSIPIALGEADLEGWSDKWGNIKRSFYEVRDYKLALKGHIKAAVDAESFEFISAQTLTNWEDVERFSEGLLQESNFNIPRPETPQARMMAGIMRRQKFEPRFFRRIQALIQGEEEVTTLPTLRKLQLLNTPPKDCEYWEGKGLPGEKIRPFTSAMVTQYTHGLAFPKADPVPPVVLQKNLNLFDLAIEALSSGYYSGGMPNHLPIVLVQEREREILYSTIQEDLEALKPWISQEGIYLVIEKADHYEFRFLGPHQVEASINLMVKTCCAKRGSKEVKKPMQNGVRRARKASGIDRYERHGRDADRPRGEEGKGLRWKRPPRPPRSGR